MHETVAYEDAVLDIYNRRTVKSKVQQPSCSAEPLPEADLDSSGCCSGHRMQVV